MCVPVSQLCVRSRSVVERVKETGVVHPKTDAVESLPCDPDPLAAAAERDGPEAGAEPVEPSE